MPEIDFSLALFTWSHETATIAADLLLRLNRNRCIFAPAPAYEGKGRPPEHGAKFSFAKPESWPETNETMAFQQAL